MSKMIERKLPNPTDFDMNDPIFNAIWEVVKHWDIRVPQYYNGITSGNGSHVMLILNEVRIAMREKKIDDIIQ